MAITNTTHDVEPLQVNQPPITIVEGVGGWQSINFGELWQYRDLFLFLTWRDIRVRYAQSVLGFGWALLSPLFSMIVFTVIFGNFVRVSSEGVPYAIFNYVAVVPWTFFASSLTDAASSLTKNRNLIQKIYFPRLIMPLAPAVSKLVDFFIAIMFVFVLMLYFQIAPSWKLIYVPLLIVLMMFTATGIGMWLTALSVQYRDINYAMRFFVQLLMYASPVVYPTSEVPERFQMLYTLNPMVGVIEGFRAAFLQTRDMPWTWLGTGAVISLILFFTGMLYFRRMERIFADVA